MNTDTVRRYINQAEASNEASKHFMDKTKTLLHGDERDFYLSQGYFLAGIAVTYTKLAEELSNG
jgi:hypothetical protein